MNMNMIWQFSSQTAIYDKSHTLFDCGNFPLWELGEGQVGCDDDDEWI